MACSDRQPQETTDAPWPWPPRTTPPRIARGRTCAPSPCARAPSASSPHRVDIAVFAVGHRGLEFHTGLLVAAIHRDESLASTREGDDSGIRPLLPMVHGGAVHIVVEGDHAARGSPPLLAIPRAVVRGARLVEIHVGHARLGGAWRARVIVGEAVVGDQPGCAIVVGERERVREREGGAVLIRQRLAVAFGVPVRHEHVRLVGRDRVRIAFDVAKALAQVRQCVERTGHIRFHGAGERELGHGAGVEIVGGLDALGLPGVADDLLNPVDVLFRHFDLLRHLLFEGLHIFGIDVFDGIHAETTHAEPVQPGQVIRL